MKNMDEMEKSIALQSVRWSWAFGIISLVLYNIYLRLTTGQSSFTLIIVFGMFIIQQLTYQYKMQQAGQDRSFWRYIALIVLFTMILLGISYIVGIL